AMLEEHGLAADSVFAASMTLTDNLETVVRQAKVLRTDCVRLDSIPKDLAAAAQGYEAYARILETAGKALHERGLKMFYHFHAFEFANFPGRRGIDVLLQDTTPAYVGFQPDVFWLTAAGTEPSSSLRLFKGRALYMHVKDYAIKSREGILESVPRMFAPVGQGNLNWPGILAAAEEAGIRLFVVEQDQCEGDPFDSIQVSFENLNKMGVF
nr:sugar phosphate isomerase/epimerase [Clostridia bacterium]